jgi:hypothetical protein
MKVITIALFLFISSCIENKAIKSSRFLSSSSLMVERESSLNVNSCHNYQLEGMGGRSFTRAHSASLRGELNIIIAEDIQRGKVEYSFRLLTATNNYLLEINDEQIKQNFINLSGAYVELGGQMKGDIFQVSSYSITNTQDQLMILREITPKFLFVIINYTNHNSLQYFSLQDVSEKAEMLKDYYKLISYDQIDIDIDADQNGSVDVGVQNVSWSFSNENYCGFQQLINSSRANSNNFGGFNTNNYTNIVFVGSRANGDNLCVNSASGIATSSGGKHYQFIPNPGPDIVWTHEAGHNFGLSHASADLNANGRIDSISTEVYGDHSCIMGNNFPSNVHPNAVNSMKLGLTDNIPNSILNVNTSGNYFISSSTDRLNNLYSKFIKFDGLNKRIVGSYRKSEDIDSTLPNKFRGFNIYLDENIYNGSSYGSTGSAFLKNLKVGQSFTESATGLKVKLVAENSDSAEIEVTYPSNGGSPPGGGSGPKPDPDVPVCARNSFNTSITDFANLEGDYVEIKLEVENKNQNCPEERNLDFNLDSEGIELTSVPKINLRDGEIKSVIMKLKVIDLDKAQGLLKMIDSSGNARGEKEINLEQGSGC